MAYDKKYPNINDEILTFDKGQEDRIGSEFESLLKISLADKGFASDLNSLRENGIYMTSGSTQNRPKNSTYGGVCLHLVRQGGINIQVHINVINAYINSRASDANGNWFEWTT